jgi:hypothetical protein
LQRQVKRQESHGGAAQQPPRTEQKRQGDQSRQRIFGEDIAVPDQAQMNQSKRQQYQESAHQQRRAARAFRKSLELDGKAHAEQQREQGERLQVDRQR